MLEKAFWIIIMEHYYHFFIREEKGHSYLRHNKIALILENLRAVLDNELLELLRIGSRKTINLLAIFDENECWH